MLAAGFLLTILAASVAARAQLQQPFIFPFSPESEQNTHYMFQWPIKRVAVIGAGVGYVFHSQVPLSLQSDKVLEVYSSTRYSQNRIISMPSACLSGMTCRAETGTIQRRSRVPYQLLTANEMTGGRETTSRRDQTTSRGAECTAQTEICRNEKSSNENASTTAHRSPFGSPWR